jgi:branched-chain amino acid transport system substrate-binding protein
MAARARNLGKEQQHQTVKEDVMTNNRPNIVRSTAVVAAVAAALLGSSTLARAEIKIGVFGPMTGDAAAYGQSERQAVDLVVKQWNAKGGVLGQDVVAVYGDDAGKPEQAVSVAKRLVTLDGVVILLGSISSPASLAASQVAEETKTPQIVVAGTAQKITTQGNAWVFRSAVPDVKLAADLVDFIHQRYPDRKKVGFIYVNDDFGKGGLDAFKKRAADYGIEIVAEEKYTRGDIDFTSQLSSIKQSGANLMVDWSRYAESALIQKQFKQMGLDMPRFGCDGQALPKFRELGGDATNGFYYATHFSVVTASDLEGAKPFIKDFKATYQRDPDYVDAEAYDAATAALLAIKAAGNTDHTAIRDALRNVKFLGTRGDFAFDAKGDPTFATHVVRIEDLKETNARLELKK